MIVPANANDRAVAVAYLQRLMLAYRKRSGGANARVSLQCSRGANAVEGHCASIPVIAISGNPEAVADVVAEMSFESAERVLRAGVRGVRGGAVGKEVIVFGEEPDAQIAIEQPTAVAVRESDFGLDGPAIGSGIHEDFRIVLTEGSRDGEARADESFLLPFHELREVHRRSALEVDRKAEAGVQQSRAIDLLRDTVDGSLKVADSVGDEQCGVCRAAEEVESVEGADDGNIDSTGCSGDRERRAERDVATVE